MQTVLKRFYPPCECEGDDNATDDRFQAARGPNVLVFS